MDPRRRLQDLAVSETGFVFDPHTGATYSTNPTGLRILQALKDGQGTTEVVDALSEQFDATGADVARDVEEFIRLLRHHGMLPETDDA